MYFVQYFKNNSCVFIYYILIFTAGGLYENPIYMYNRNINDRENRSGGDGS